MGHQSSEELAQLLTAAQAKIQTEQIYHHYKDATKSYRIIALALDEASETVSVVYEALYAPYFRWIRPLSNFLETVVWNGQIVPRFQEVKSKR